MSVAVLGPLRALNAQALTTSDHDLEAGWSVASRRGPPTIGGTRLNLGDSSGTWIHMEHVLTARRAQREPTIAVTRPLGPRQRASSTYAARRAKPAVRRNDGSQTKRRGREYVAERRRRVRLSGVRTDIHAGRSTRCSQESRSRCCWQLEAIAVASKADNPFERRTSENRELWRAHRKRVEQRTAHHQPLEHASAFGRGRRSGPTSPNTLSKRDPREGERDPSRQ
jgi:hypothetical protein